MDRNSAPRIVFVQMFQKIILGFRGIGPQGPVGFRGRAMFVQPMIPHVGFSGERGNASSAMIHFDVGSHVFRKERI